MNKYYLEIQNQHHLMVAEGTSDKKPTKNKISQLIKKRGYIATEINIFYDTFQKLWRFNTKIKEYVIKLKKGRPKRNDD